VNCTGRPKTKRRRKGRKKAGGGEERGRSGKGERREGWKRGQEAKKAQCQYMEGKRIGEVEERARAKGMEDAEGGSGKSLQEGGGWDGTYQSTLASMSITSGQWSDAP
jgi:hypothetical protein